MSKNNDTRFKMSAAGGLRVRELARALGFTPAKTFRSMAGALAVMPSPTVSTSGQPLTEKMDVGVNEYTVTALANLCEELNLPVEAMGELVAMANYTNYAERWA